MPQVFGDYHDVADRRWVQREKRRRDRDQVVRESLARKKGELSAAETELRIWKRKLSKLESQQGAAWEARALDQALEATKLRLECDDLVAHVTLLEESAAKGSSESAEQLAVSAKRLRKATAKHLDLKRTLQSDLLDCLELSLPDDDGDDPTDLDYSDEEGGTASGGNESP